MSLYDHDNEQHQLYLARWRGASARGEERAKAEAERIGPPDRQEAMWKAMFRERYMGDPPGDPYRFMTSAKRREILGR